MHTAVFSIISPNYRHFARVLMASVQRNHPEWERFVLLVGGEPDSDAHRDRVSDEDDEPFTTIPLEALSLPNPRSFAFRYSILELNTAVKPWMFEQLFARGYDRVVYLDPDIVVYSPLEELDAVPVGTLLTLTPHLTGPIGGDEHPSERTIGLAGAYNLGFLAVSRHPALDRFLGWWQEKLEYQCVVDPARGLFVDQKWIDLVPGLFPDVTILRHEGYNVAYWNLGQRTVTRDAAIGGTVNGQPLRFFHFSGFDPALPQMVSRHHHKLTLAEVGDARTLIEDYGAALQAAGYDSFRNAPYAFRAFADGTPVPNAARIAYRNTTDLQEAA
ncbi:MAG: glycosyl transferase group 1, partial [Acidobacteria bacterium]|nr:glycosyl transferase group 1 [Acidobacteriota bacterium]